jgi:hypothetical protein
MRLLGWTEEREPAVERDGPIPRADERRSEPREDCKGLKLIIRQRRALGIIHLSNISSWGACGITDMPLAPGSLVFLELRKGHFYGARVKWVHRFTLGLQLARQMRPEMMRRLLSDARKAREPQLRALH